MSGPRVLEGGWRPDCRDFNGYKPCRPGWVCRDCAQYRPKGTRVLLINLDAMGTVLRTTSLLPAIVRRYPDASVVWVTSRACLPLLEGNPLVAEAVPYEPATVDWLCAQRFDVLLSCDKSRPAASLAMRVPAARKLGYGIDPAGAIVPLNPEAAEHYAVGLDDRLKFFVNRKTEQQLLTEALDLPYARDEYVLVLSDAERAFVEEARRRFGLDGPQPVVGLNTGCSDLFPYKKLPVTQQAELIDRLHAEFPGVRVALLGGREDTARNREIARLARTGERVVQTPTDEGLRRGLLYVDLCDLVISGDTLGMHMAIALRKEVVAWFGISCEQEIDFFGRGEAVTAHVSCRPCWKRSCELEPKCYDRVSTDEILAAVRRRLPAAEAAARRRAAPVAAG
ncbi:MAG TPA: glycosyltransferase family 9 protein, partial [Thermodesulfobacteriota bacterium]|nr:glycosyltransferase family 9 protein [Thermodesulfobacteriota bacterium]